MRSHVIHKGLFSLFAAAALGACSAGDSDDLSPAGGEDGPIAAAAEALDTAIPARWRAFPQQSHVTQATVASTADGSLALFDIKSGAVQFSRQTAPGAGWTAPVSLGGTSLRELAATRNSDGRLEFFAIGGDRILYRQNETSPGGGWSGWATLGGSGITGVATAQNQDGRLQVFTVNGDKRVYEAHQVSPNAGLTGLTLIGGSNLVRIAAVAPGFFGRVTLFGLSSTGELFTSQQISPSSVGAWTSWTSLGGAGATDLRAVRTSDGRIEVVVGGPYGLYHIAQTGPESPWGSWSALGNGSPGTFDPAVTAFDVLAGDSGDLHVFTAHDDDALYPNQDGSKNQSVHYGKRSGTSGSFAWQGKIGEYLATVSAGRDLDGRLEVFAAEPANYAYGSLYQTWQTQAGGPWRPLPPKPIINSFTYSPTQPYYGSTVTVSWNYAAPDCSDASIFVSLNPIGSSSTSSDDIINWGHHGSPDSVTFTFKSAKTLRGSVFCRDDEKSPVRVPGDVREFDITGTSAPPTTGTAGPYGLYMSAEQVSSGYLPYRVTFGELVNQGHVVSLTNPTHGYNGYFDYALSLIPPGAPNSACFSSSAVYLAPGATTTSADLDEALRDQLAVAADHHPGLRVHAELGDPAQPVRQPGHQHRLYVRAVRRSATASASRPVLAVH
ncbi:MAG: hypothetical protein QM820_35670 [Minicystis sp.]